MPTILTSRLNTRTSKVELDIYNGPADWTIPEQISELIDHSVPDRYIPSFSYYQIIEKEIPDEILLQIKGIVSAIIYMEKRKDEETLRSSIDQVIDLIKAEQPEIIRMFTVWLNRMFRNAVLPVDIDKVRDARGVRSMLSKIAEEMEARGEARGRIQGVKEGMRIAARKMKDNGEPIEKIQEYTGLDREEIEEL